MQEIKQLRKKREKHFLEKDGTMTAYLYKKDIHYLKKGNYQEIDNTIIETKDNYQNKANEIKIIFPKESNRLMKIKKANNYLTMSLINSKKEKPTLEKNKITYQNIYPDIDIIYEIKNEGVKETFLLKKPSLQKAIIFEIETNLTLKLEKNIIIAKKQEIPMFQMEAPFAIDRKEIEHHNFNYQLKKISSKKYQLILPLDNEWLQKKERVYPIAIDPSIHTSNEGVYDTFIFPGDQELNRDELNVLKVGVDTENKIYRSLLKFDLPTIATGSSVINATFSLWSHKEDSAYYNYEYMNVHAITSDWNEKTVNWDMIHDKYDSHVEDCTGSERTHVTYEDGKFVYRESLNSGNITNIVKKWYAGKPNYGIMLKWDREYLHENTREYDFYFKEVENGEPFLVIQYRNQNGLENYMSYQSVNYTSGTSFFNNLNGNHTLLFHINETNAGKPIELNAIYNTNDVILKKDFGGGLGWKWNYQQIIQEVTIDSEKYLEYLDEDGTFHYFWKEKKSDTMTEEEYQKIPFIDEDGLGLSLSLENNQYRLKDKENNQMIFQEKNSRYYLIEIIDVEEKSTKIIYDERNYITKIIHPDLSEINLLYEQNKITSTSNTKTSIVHLENNQVTSIETKNGTTTFLYNDKNLIERINDFNGKSLKIDYYDTMPYRVKKINDFGLNNESGKTLDFEYGFDTTKITDLDGRINSYIFNHNGVTIGVTNLSNSEDLDNGYGNSRVYNEENYSKNNNKLLLETLPIKYTKNYIKNSSFEKPNDTLEISDTTAKTGTHSLKINNLQKIDIPELSETGYYTFSGYFKNDSNITIEIKNIIDNSKRNELNINEKNEEFTRYSLTTMLEKNQKYQIQVSSSSQEASFLDDIQLEKGEITNYYNIAENSDFSENMSGWTNSVTTMDGTTIENTDEIITLSNGKKVYEMKNKQYTSKSLSQKIKTSGKKGETYNLSFWYKNLGYHANNMYDSNIALVTFGYPPNEDGHCTLAYVLNLHSSEWQFFSNNFVTEYDYHDIYINFISQKNGNELYLTNISLIKDLEQNTYQYDERGNLISATDISKATNQMKYDKNNQLVSSFNPKGNNFAFEYDNTITNRLLKGISPTGITNEIKYDSFGNPQKTIIRNLYPGRNLTENNYYIRLKGTKKYVSMNKIIKQVELKENTCSKDIWKLEKVEEHYCLRNAIVPIYIAFLNNKLFLTRYQTKDTLFNLFKNENGSYKIIPNNQSKVLGNDSDILTLQEDKEDFNQQFYFEKTNNSEYMESTAEYTEDGNFIKKTTDNLGISKYYQINRENGLTESTTDELGNQTNYTYNELEHLTEVKKNNLSVHYDYNQQNLLSKINSGNKQYNFTYDNFLNPKQVKIGTQVLVTNEYEINDGNLKKTIYGNESETNFTYDELDRIKKLNNDTNEYNYYYDNIGNLARIKSNEETTNYYYDLAQRLSTYETNQFQIDYDYDINSNITLKKFKLDENKTIQYTYNEDDSIIKVSFDETNLNYTYDELGRLTKKNINNQNPIEYEYYKNGNKSSMTLKSMKIKNNLYEYEYDKLYNITNIYINKEKINHYEYDNQNQLIKEDNVKQNKTIRYLYDNDGNILKKIEYELNTNNFIKENNYEYTNTNWCDQLTKYNGTALTYDSIGNPLSIGSIQLNWQNGRELKSYNDPKDNLNIEYKYNKDGIRTSKKIFEKEIKYFTENSQIIFEKRNQDMLYYIRDDNNNLIGFQYNNKLYYYEKNIQEDIIGITDELNVLLATYEYDSWGNIISIKDNEGNDISNDTNNIANINPFRYRSYYYDTDTKLYYLNSRYYNPEWGRFLNADGIIGANNNHVGYNLYAYVENNPINNIDQEGKFALAIFGVFAGLGALITAVVTVVKVVTAVAVGIGAAVIAKNATKNSTDKKDDNQKKYKVYTLSKSNSKGKIEYVGRTNDQNRRQAEHKASKYRSTLSFSVEYVNLTYSEARGKEQELILKNHTLTPGFYPGNQINGISNKNPKYRYFMDAASNLILEETYIGDGIIWDQK